MFSARSIEKVHACCKIGIQELSSEGKFKRVVPTLVDAHLGVNPSSTQYGYLLMAWHGRP